MHDGVDVDHVDVADDEPIELDEPAAELSEPVGPVEPVLPDESDPAVTISSPPPADMPPPMSPPIVVPDVVPTVDSDLDPQALKALSRQERKEAKAAARQEARHSRDAARQAKAAARVAAKSGNPLDPDPLDQPGAAGAVPVTDVVAAAAAAVAAAEAVETTEHPPMEWTAIDPPADDVDVDPGSADGPAAAPTDPRARAAARVQRRLGRDADKLSAAESRARAREEARQRRTQAKETPAGVFAQEPVIREPELPVEPDVDVAETVVFEPVLDAPVAPSIVEPEPVVEEVSVPEPEPVVEDVIVAEPVTQQFAPVVQEPVVEEVIVRDEVRTMPPPAAVTPQPQPQVEVAAPRPAESPRSWETETTEAESRSPLASIAGIVGLVALGISVLLAVGALLVALGVDSGGLYSVLERAANTLVGPLANAFDFSGSGAERKEHFLAWGAGSILYLLLSFAGQAVQRANTDDQ